MNKSKKVIDIKMDDKEPEKPKTNAKKEFEALVEAYKKQNPAKYEHKKDALEAKLKSL